MLSKLQRATRKTSHVRLGSYITPEAASRLSLTLLLFLKLCLHQLLPGDAVEEDPRNPLEMREGAFIDSFFL
jgi:hypothetical protein